MSEHARARGARFNPHRWANPGRFARLAERAVPPLAWVTAALLLVGLVGGLVLAPPDFRQGMSVKIIYVHVPSAWLGLFAYVSVAAASAAALVWRHPLADIAAHAASPVGAAFTALALATGSLWGKPMWGAWWVWDARLTSMLVLLFLYLGHIALKGAFDDPAHGRTASAILAVVGVVNVPIIKFSVDWWNTLHQTASVSRLDSPAMPMSMLWPLLVMAVGFTTFFVTVVLVRMRAGLLEARIQALRTARLRREDA